MAWSMCAGIRSISSAGRRKAPRAGALAACCPTSAARRAFKAAQTPIAATPGRWRRRMDPWVATSRLRRSIAGVGGRRAHAVPHRHVEGSKPLLPLAVEVGADRIARLPTRLDESVVGRVICVQRSTPRSKRGPLARLPFARARGAGNGRRPLDAPRRRSRSPAHLGSASAEKLLTAEPSCEAEDMTAPATLGRIES